MSVILKRYKGESTTFGFVLPPTYDLANMEDVKVYIGAKEYPHTMDNVRTVKAKLTSDDTLLLSGRQSVIFHIDDAIFGIRKVLVGEFQVDTSTDLFSDESINTGYDALVMLSVDVETIEVGSILYDVAKGDKGDSAFTVWQSQTGNEGKTEQEYFDYLQEPAVSATNAANEAAILANQKAGEASQAATLANTKAGDANSAAIAANNAAGNANTKAALADDAAILANTKADLANDAAIYANEKGDLANTKAGLAEDAANNANSKANEANLAATAANEAADLANDAANNADTKAGLANDAAIDANQATIDANQAIDNIASTLFKTLNIGTGGMVTMKPTTSNFTYRLNVLSNLTLNIDLSKMIQQVGNARCRLIIDMPIVRTITITKPLLWGGTAPTFAAAGQYIFEIIDVDGSGTPLIWQVASTTKVEPTGNILFVDSTGADYSVGQINSGTPTRTTSSWATPFKYLQNAINAAQAGDVIFVKEGIYKPTHLRTTPTVYVDDDRLNRNATFTPKNGVDIYGGFVGTETKTWQRVMDANGYPVAKTILCGDIAGEATVDPAKTVGDTRTDASKANAAFNVVFGRAISALTYLNGVNVRYGNASEATGDQSVGGGIYSAALFVGINNIAYSNTATTLGGGWYGCTNTNCTAYNNTASHGGGWYLGTNTNCTAYSNTGTRFGGGWRDGTNTNCTAYSNTASYGGGWHGGVNTNCTVYSNTGTSHGGGWYEGTNINCTAYSNTATIGGGWHSGTNINCTAYSNTATTLGGGWNLGTNTNCTAYNNTADYGGGWNYGTNINCISYSNTASTYGGGWNLGTNINCTAYNNTATSGGGWRDGTNTNCTGVNNKAPQAVFGNTTTDTHINCLLYNNKTAAGIAVGFDDKAATDVKIFRNNAYDVAHPTITGGAGSDINTSTCIQNLTLEQAKIDVPTLIGAATTPEQLAELHAYAATITTKLKPKAGSVLKGAGVNNATYPNPTDYEGTARPEASTIGILEGE